MSSDIPTIGIAMGDPAGAGAEIIVKALSDPQLRNSGRFVVFGQNELMTYAADMAEIDVYWWRGQHDTLRSYDHSVVVADYDEFSLPGIGIRRATREGGEASLRFVSDAVDAAQAGKIQGIVCGPISRESWRLAGCGDSLDQSGFLAKLFRVRYWSTMYASGLLRVATATNSEPLFDLRHRFTIGCVFSPIDLLHQALTEKLGFETPRIGVAALNPTDPGANGRRGGGDEESRIIAPAITMAKEAGIDCDGPLPADRMFREALRGTYDGVVAMYYEQGVLPLKVLNGVSVSYAVLGLPIAATGVDPQCDFRNTAYGTADCQGLKAAIQLAVEMASAPSPTSEN
jgi:4-hydroxythreonine-4-phosphate dehydrogenase